MADSPTNDAPANGGQREASQRGLCPHCGALCDLYQEYCLECGERLVETGVVSASLADRWRRAAPSSPSREWFWPVGVALVVAVAAATFAIFAGRESQTTTFQALGPPVTRQSAPATTGSSGQTTRTSKTTTAPAANQGLISWPGQPAYTIMLASIPSSMGKLGARQKALDAINAGLSDVGVLDSSDYSSLHPGYYVVFSGVYETEQKAMEHIDSARSAGFPQPYVKRVSS